ncbi:LysM peptidoglycan-binding domain-containing protein [Aeromicrobium phragmitis]|uniref:LysM peptidoglycan-binding domain-containing protein n=1 Tax=Aeromicrobium phragmitis TaxID=2478914 RepID=A0A3L8PHX4_9ACTN|nr:LysM domain-containing protein [Aeromicrobium phragmitis]RLV54811.1 LysM peptidoglycan-binding domain-containing protein [Aeromicrobium phragmitis]
MTYRSIAVAVLSTAITATALPQVPRWLRLAGEGDLEAVVSYGAATGATLLLAWCAVLSLLALVDVRLVRRLAPRWALALLLGGVAGGLVAGPASGSSELDGLRLPERPLGATAASTEASPAVQHRVVAGDSLWTIASRHLPPGHDVADAAAATTAWYEHNRDVIGPNPDHIVPGQVLLAPEANR